MHCVSCRDCVWERGRLLPLCMYLVCDGYVRCFPWHRSVLLLSDWHVRKQQVRLFCPSVSSFSLGVSVCLSVNLSLFFQSPRVYVSVSLSRCLFLFPASFCPPDARSRSLLVMLCILDVLCFSPSFTMFFNLTLCGMCDPSPSVCVRLPVASSPASPVPRALPTLRLVRPLCPLAPPVQQGATAAAVAQVLVPHAPPVTLRTPPDLPPASSARVDRTRLGLVSDGRTTPTGMSPVPACVLSPSAPVCLCGCLSGFSHCAPPPCIYSHTSTLPTLSSPSFSHVSCPCP